MPHILAKYEPHITLHSCITIPRHSHNIILRNIIKYLSTTYRDENNLDTEVEDEVEEALEEVEDRWYVITVNI
jgi:hypothetical protein